MNKIAVRFLALLGMVLLMSGFAVAKPMSHGKKVETKAVYCPVCHMKLATHANQYRPVKVKIDGHIYYCCSKCKMPAKYLVKTTPKHGKMGKMHGKMGKMGMMHGKAMMCPYCHMPLSLKKTKANPVEMKLHGHIYYCCKMCKMPASVLVHPSKMGKMGKMHGMKMGH